MLPRQLKNRPKPEELFLSQIELLLKNLFITNKNFTNGYYHSKGVSELINDNKERAQWIIDEMERTKHLINIGDEYD